MPKKSKAPAFALLRIETDSYTETTREADPEDSWDNDDVCYHITIRGFSVVDKDSGEVFAVPTPVLPQYYLVYVVYGTGDSFHHEDGLHYYIGLYANFDDAQAVSQAIEQDNRKERDQETTLRVKLSNGSVQNICTSSWKGYFEHLTGVEIETVARVRK
jgi:3D (Asp-Asp-Asp) domain-containing protein